MTYTGGYTAQALFDVLCKMRPAHHLIAADFDALPDVVVSGKNAPLVASKVLLEELLSVFQKPLQLL